MVLKIVSEENRNNEMIFHLNFLIYKLYIEYYFYWFFYFIFIEMIFHLNFLVCKLFWNREVLSWKNK